jgi:hypothetical protein
VTTESVSWTRLPQRADLLGPFDGDDNNGLNEQEDLDGRSKFILPQVDAADA